jgi:hypothetical protein
VVKGFGVVEPYDSRAMEARTLLDELMPTYDVRSRHTIRIAASPTVVYETARSVDLGRPLLVRLLIALRAAPALLAAAARRRRSTLTQSCDRRSVGAAPFTLVAEAPGHEFVLGVIGRFWAPSGGLVVTGPEAFRGPPPAGLAQAIWSFRVSRVDSGSELTTETRVRCGDLTSRKRFQQYWTVVRLGSGLIRYSILRHIRRVAERREGMP